MSNKTKGVGFLKLGLIYTISNIVVKGIVFLTTPLFTRLMSQEDFGIFSGISAWANIISVIVTLSLYSSISRAKYDFKEDLDKYISSILLFGNIVTLIFWIIVELNFPFFEKIFSINRMFIRSILLYCLFYPAVQMLLLKYRMNNEYKKVVFITWITLLVSVFASLILVYISTNKLAGRVFGTYLIVSFVNIFFWLEILKKGKSFNFAYIKYACILSIPLVFHELSGILLNSSDRIIINNLLGGEKAALYSLAYTIATVITVLLSSINQAWVPWFYDNLDTENYHTIRKVSEKYSVVIAIGCIGLMLIGPEITYIFGGPNYVESIYVIPPISLSIYIQYLYTQYVNIEFFLKKTLYISIATIGATGINIALNYILIPKYGFIAAAYTTIIGYFFMLIFHYYICDKTKYNNIFNKRIFLVMFTIVAFFTIVSLLVYNNGIVRYVILLLFIIFTFAYMIKNIKQLRRITKGENK